MTTNHETVVTVKGKRNTDAWFVFHGSPAEIVADIVTTFGIPQETADKLTLNDLTIHATKIAHGEQVVATVLGAVPIETKVGKEADTSPELESEQDDSDQGTNPNAALIEKLNGAESTEELRELWVDNKSAFNDPEVKSAYNKRGSALKKQKKGA